MIQWRQPSETSEQHGLKSLLFQGGSISPGLDFGTLHALGLYFEELVQSLRRNVS